MLIEARVVFFFDVDSWRNIDMLKSFCSILLLLSFLLSPFLALVVRVDWTPDQQESSTGSEMNAASPNVLAHVRSSAESWYELLRGAKTDFSAAELVTFVVASHVAVAPSPGARVILFDAQHMITSGVRLQV
jgi:hypothetical protein